MSKPDPLPPLDADLLSLEADLCQALRAGLAADPEDSAALQQRLMQQWDDAQQAQRHLAQTPWGRVLPLPLRRRAWAGAVAGLLLSAALGWGWWQQQQAEAALAELSEVDVLSQIGAGEI